MKRPIALFHPPLLEKGGGERVALLVLKSLLDKNQHAVVLLSSKFASKIAQNSEEIRKEIDATFGISFTREDFNRTKFVPLYSSWLTFPGYYPILTMFFQLLCFVAVGLEAGIRCWIEGVDTLIDTLGNSFIIPGLRSVHPWLVISEYIHYPIVSGIMVENAKEGKKTKLSKFIAPIRSLYCNALRWLYSITIRLVNGKLMANSLWTKNALLARQDISVVYPPVNLSFYRKGYFHTPRLKWIMSCSQFRPEKNQSLQLEIIYELKKRRKSDFKFHMCGNLTDQGMPLFEELKAKARILEIEDVVEFRPNISKQDLRTIMHNSMACLNTMRDEHFGIAIVEQMSAGCLIVSHSSGGVKLDILKEEDGEVPGYLCLTIDDFVASLQFILERFNEKTGPIARKIALAKKVTDYRFSDDESFQSFMSWVFCIK